MANDQRWQHVHGPQTNIIDSKVGQVNVYHEHVRVEADGSRVESAWFVLELARCFRGPAAWGSGPVTAAPSIAPALVWQHNSAAILSYLRPWLERGWTPIESPGPQHLLLHYVPGVRGGVVAANVGFGLAEAGFGFMHALTAAFGMGSSPRIFRAPTLPVDKWEAYADRYQILMTRRLPPDVARGPLTLPGRQNGIVTRRATPGAARPSPTAREHRKGIRTIRPSDSDQA